MQNVSPRIGVTGIHVASAPKSGAVVLKELLSHTHYSCIALADYPQTCALGWNSPKLSGIFQIPQSILGGRDLFDRLKQINDEMPFDILIPCDDEDLLVLAGQVLHLNNIGIQTLIPSENAALAVQKEHFSITMDRIGILTPNHQVIQTPKAMEDIILKPPLIVKGRLIHAYLARTVSEVQAFADKLFNVWGGPVILQEYINGAEFSVAAVADRKSRLAGICAIRKIGISDQGKTWMAVSILPDGFISIIERLFRSLQWVGPLEVEFIADLDGKNPVAIEINPRFPAWISIARHTGADLIGQVIALCQNKDMDTLSGRPGICFVRNYVTECFNIKQLAQLHAHQKTIAEKRGEL